MPLRSAFTLTPLAGLNCPHKAFWLQNHTMSNSNISSCSVPLAAEEQVWDCKLAPGPPEVTDLCSHFLQSFEGVGVVVNHLEISRVAQPSSSVFGVITAEVNLC